jgi:glycosyltransferase involved in cell wall biosynthesis
VPEPVKVLEVAARYLPDLGGVEAHVHEIATRLSSWPELRVSVAATDRKKEYPAFEVRESVPVLRCRAWPASRDYYFAPGLRRFIRGGGWDLIHVQGIHTLAPIISMLAARRAGVPYVVTFHSGGTSSGLRRVLRSAQWRLLGPLLRDAAELVAVSRFEQKLFARAIGIPPERIQVVAFRLHRSRSTRSRVGSSPADASSATRVTIGLSRPWLWCSSNGPRPTSTSSERGLTSSSCEPAPSRPVWPTP